MSNKTDKERESALLNESGILIELLIWFLVFSLIFTSYLGYLDFTYSVLELERSLIDSFILMSFSILLITFHIYAICLILKRKRNAVFATTLLLTTLTISTFFRIVGIFIFKEGYDILITELPWIFFYIVFILFLHYSESIKKEFPKNKREKNGFEILLIILILSIWLIV